MLTKEAIHEVVKKNVIETLSEVSEFTEADYDPGTSMHLLGASSLDVVEIVSRTVRELKVKIPFSKMSDVENSNELVDVLYHAANTNEH